MSNAPPSSASPLVAPPLVAPPLAQPPAGAARLWDRFALLGACIGALSALTLESPGIELRCPPGLTGVCAAGACLVGAWRYGRSHGKHSPVTSLTHWLETRTCGPLGSRARRFATAAVARAL